MRRVLFVDDEPNILDGLRDLLRKYRREMEMVFALGSEAALRELDRAPFDVIVSDMRMPGMDGAALLQTVRRKYPDIARIILSGHADREAIFMALPVSHQFLAKPCEADRLCNVIERACSLRSLLGDDSLRRAVGGIEKLPSIPSIYHQLMSAMARPDVSAKTIGGIIERDPAMSAKILQFVNSACFGTAQSIAGIERAVVHLGMELIKNLALTVQVFSALSKSARHPSLSFEDLQEHSMTTARSASALLSDPQEAQYAFTAGLLHDIGKLILAVCAPDRLGKMLDAAPGWPDPEAEAEILGVTHAQIGAYLLGLWGLPYPVVEAVAFHHRPFTAGEPVTDTMSAVRAANAIAEPD